MGGGGWGEVTKRRINGSHSEYPAYGPPGARNCCRHLIIKSYNLKNPVR